LKSSQRRRADIKRILWGALLMAVAGTGVQAGSGSPDDGPNYVNMGSSFAAGSGIPPAKSQSVERCLQSAASYASLLAENLKLTLDDRGCAGARSAHLLEPWTELPPQIDAVTPDTKLVTITVGGNDLNYVSNLMAAGCAEDEGLTFGDRSVPCFEESPPPEDAYIQLEKNLREIARQISTRAPSARIVFIQYVSLIPNRLCEATPLTADEAHRLGTVAERLAAITAATAEASGAMLLPLDTLSIEHTACGEDPWSIGAFTTSENSQGMSWHPNRRANQVIAEQLQGLLEP
jgi:lysophospholipase L1-like esterase